MAASNKALFRLRLVLSLDSSTRGPLRIFVQFLAIHDFDSNASGRFGVFLRFLTIGDIDWPLFSTFARLLFFHSPINVKFSE